MSSQYDLDALLSILSDTNSFIFFGLAVFIMLLGFLAMICVFAVNKARKYFNRRDAFFSTVNKKIRVASESKYWIFRSFFWKSDEVFDTLGLDSLILLKSTKLFLSISLVISVITLVILLPVHIISGQSNHTLLIMTSFSVIPEKSNFLWLHLILIYFVTFIVYAALYHEWKDVVKFRQKYFLADPVSACSLLFSDLGDNSDNQSWEVVIKEKMMKIVGHSDLLLVHVLKDVTCIKELIQEHNRLVSRRYSSEDQEVDPFNSNLTNDRARVYYNESESSTADDAISKNYSKLIVVARAVVETPLNAVIVIVSNVALSQTFRCTSLSLSKNHVRVSVLPEQTSIIWRNLVLNKNIKKFNTGLIMVLTVIAILFWAVPFTGVAAITKILPGSNESSIHIKSKGFSIFIQFLSNTLIPLILIQLILYLEHLIFKKLSTYENHVSYVAAEFSILKKMCVFNAVNTFFIYTISSSILEFAQQIIEKPIRITIALASAIPLQSNFYMIYLAFQTLIMLPWIFVKGNYFLFECLHNIKSCFIKSHRCSDGSFKGTVRPLNSDYIYKYSYLILVFGIGLSFSLLSPLISIVWIPYFVVAYIFFAYDEERNNLNKFLYNGEFWPIVSNAVMAYLIFMQIIMIGMFITKLHMFLAFLIFPCCILTMFYGRYLRNHFYKSFSYPTFDTMKELKSLTENQIQDKCNLYRVEAFIPERNETSSDIIWRYIMARELFLRP